jgi:hypothetical protein
LPEALETWAVRARAELLARKQSSNNSFPPGETVVKKGHSEKQHYDVIGGSFLVNHKMNSFSNKTNTEAACALSDEPNGNIDPALLTRKDYTTFSNKEEFTSTVESRENDTQKLDTSLLVTVPDNSSAAVSDFASAVTEDALSSVEEDSEVVAGLFPPPEQIEMELELPQYWRPWIDGVSLLIAINIQENK